MKTNGFVIRVVQWIYDKKGKNEGQVGGSVSLEKRETYLNDNEEIRNGKSKGFSLEDLAVIQKEWNAIIKTMKSPPKPEFSENARETTKKAPQPSEEAPADIEEVPF